MVDDEPEDIEDDYLSDMDDDDDDFADDLDEVLEDDESEDMDDDYLSEVEEYDDDISDDIDVEEELEESQEEELEEDQEEELEEDQEEEPEEDSLAEHDHEDISNANVAENDKNNCDISDYTVRLAVASETVKLPLEEVLTMAPGSVLSLESNVSDAFNIMINGETSGKGMLADINGVLGIIITEWNYSA